MRISGTIVFLTFINFSVSNARAEGLRSYFNNYYDEIATSTCTALSISHGYHGHIAAVRRTCGTGPSCVHVCKNAKGNIYYKGNCDSFKSFF